MDQKDTEMNEKGVSSSTSGVVVQVREKKGPLRAAIPYMPFPVAVICLFLNTFVPGLGTFISAFTVLCGARTDLPDRHVCCVFWLNIAAAFIQILTAVVMVGWIMSIFWGMDMVILASLTTAQPGQPTFPVGLVAPILFTSIHLCSCASHLLPSVSLFAGRLILVLSAACQSRAVSVVPIIMR
ncbi:hypothetical protein MHYP_G00053370 [Metynnis hypsauchen]